MNSLRRHMKQLSLIMVILMSFATTFSVSAHAGMVGTGELIQQQQTDLDGQSSCVRFVVASRSGALN